MLLTLLKRDFRSSQEKSSRVLQRFMETIDYNQGIVYIISLLLQFSSDYSGERAVRPKTARKDILMLLLVSLWVRKERKWGNDQKSRIGNLLRML